MRSSTLAALLFLALAAPAAAQPAPPPTALPPTAPSTPGIRTIARVLATGDVDGRFAHPVCDGRETLHQEDHAAFTYALMREANAEDRPLVVDTGGLLAPHGVARFSAERHPESLATMVQRVGYRALALGLDDLAAPRAGLVSVARELRARRIPIVASNLRCAPEQQELCDQLVDASDGVSTHVVNGRLTAFIAVLRENALHSVAPDLAEGLELEPPRETIERFTRMARERGAELVVAVIDGRLEGGPIELATQIEPDARPNVLLVSGYDELLFARPRTVRPVLVGTLERETVEVRIRESVEIMDGYEMLAQPLEGRGITVAEPVLDWIDEIGEEYCVAWGQELAGAHLEEPIDVPGMLDMVAEIMRYETGADIAVINRQALDRRWRAAREGSLTASDVYIALEYDEPLQVATVDERWLQALARQADSTGNLVTPGLEFEIDGTSTSVHVGGHATASRQDYRVVTLRFLASGGDEDLIPPLPNGSSWETLEGDTGTLRGMVLDHLDRERDEDPRENLPSTEETTEWTFGASVDLGLSASTIENPLRECTPEELAMMPSPCDDEGFFLNEEGERTPFFGTTQLLFREVLSFSIASDFRANAAAPDWTWESSASARYQTIWASTSNSYFESQDQIRARSGLSWTGLRDDTVVPARSHGRPVRGVRVHAGADAPVALAPVPADGGPPLPAHRRAAARPQRGHAGAAARGAGPRSRSRRGRDPDARGVGLPQLRRSRGAAVVHVRLLPRAARRRVRGCAPRPARRGLRPRGPARDHHELQPPAAARGHPLLGRFAQRDGGDPAEHGGPRDRSLIALRHRRFC